MENQPTFPVNTNKILGMAFFNYQIFAIEAADSELNIPSGKSGMALMVVLKSEDHHPESTDFLQKILSAIALQLDRDARMILLPEKKGQAWLSHQKATQAKRVIFFGWSPIQLGFSSETKFYKSYSMLESQFLMCHSLRKIEKERNLRQELWQMLKTWFAK